jgi:hypothetical protein
MDLTSQITVSLKPELSKSLGNMRAFAPGSTLQLKILELRGDRALIDFGNFRATADVKIPVTLGEELQVKVLSSGKQLKLAVISPEPKGPSAIEMPKGHLEATTAQNIQKLQADLKQMLSQVMGTQTEKKLPSSILNILDGLIIHFETIDLNKSLVELIPQLKSIIENSGIFFEKSLENLVLKYLVSADDTIPKSVADLPEAKRIFNHDLKANLLALRTLLEDGKVLQKFFSPKGLTILNNLVDNLLDNITQQQGRAIGQLKAADPFQVFTYLLPLKEQDQTAKLKIYHQKKHKSVDDKGFRISLLLSLDRLGDLRTDFFLLDRDLSLTFIVEDNGTKADLQEKLFELHEMLQGSFDQMRLNVIVSKKKVMDFDREDLQITGHRRVDLRI